MWKSYSITFVRKSPKKKLADVIKEKSGPSESMVSEPERSHKEKSVSSSSSSVSKVKKSKKAKKSKSHVVSSSESDSGSDWDESDSLIDQRYDDLGTQERAKIRAFKTFYISTVL